MAVIEPLEHKKKNARIDWLKLLSKARQDLKLDMGKFQPAMVITDETFRYFEKTGDLSITDDEKIRKALASLFKISKSKMLVVKRAYAVPGMENPTGPRFLGLKSVEEAVNAIKELYTYAIENKYNVKKGSLIEVCFYPFTDPPQIKPPIDENEILPRGGNSIALDEKGDIIEIMAVFGNNEGVQSLEYIDEYVVDTKNKLILSKKIPQKLFGLFTTRNAQDEKLKVPLSKQFEQVFSDLEILEIALVTAKCTELKGIKQRTEFSTDTESMYFNEVIDYKPEEKQTKEVTIKGITVVIETEEDLAKITDPKKQIIYISKVVAQKRDYSVLNEIASFGSKLNILYPGTAATAHIMRVLVDAGHNAFVVGNKVFKDGQTVQFKVISNAAKLMSESNPKIVPLKDASLYTKSLVGGKAYNLAKLDSFGFRVPNGYVITSNKTDINEFLTSKEFIDFKQTLSPGGFYSIRSSADVEDTGNNAFAGQFKSILPVKFADIEKSIIEVWNSAQSKHVQALVKKLDIPRVRMAVIVQELVESKISGVTFGANIETKNNEEVILNITKGYAANVVDDVGDIRKIRFDKRFHTIIDDLKNTDNFIVRKELIKMLFTMYLRVESLFGNIQDIEWTIDDKGDLYVLQTRDLII